MKVHQSLGHPHNRTLSRILKDAGCREEVWRAAIHLKCHVCQRLRRPELEPVAASKGLPEPSEVILSDGLEWEHAVSHNMTQAILIMDEGSHLVLSVVTKEVLHSVRLGNISGEMFRDSVVERWFPCFGRPKVIRVDPDGAFISNCLLYTSPSPRDRSLSRMPSSA